MAKQLLHATNIIPILQQVRSKTVPESVAAAGFLHVGRAHSVSDRILQIALREVVPAFFAGARIDRNFIGRKNVLPDPFAGRFRVLAMEGVAQVNGAATPREVLLVELFDAGQVRLKRMDEAIREDRDPLPHSLAFADGDLAVTKIDVFDSQAEALEKAEAASV